jgi:hypothetical protein
VQEPLNVMLGSISDLNTVILPKKMNNIDTYKKALQIKWILRLLENSNKNWKIIPQKYFENIGENFLIFNMNLDSFKSLENELTKNIPAFYKELLKTWITCRGRENKNFREIRKQIIWGNKYIKYKGKFSPIFSKYFCGIIFQFSLLFSNNLNIHFICKAFI